MAVPSTAQGASDGAQIFEDRPEECQASDAQAQKGHTQERQRRQGQEPQAGDCHRSVGSAQEGCKGSSKTQVKEEIQEVTAIEPINTPVRTTRKTARLSMLRPAW